jgi:hypothetical protein
MRVTLSLVAVLLAAAFLTAPARAQASIPYRRTIDYIPNRPYEFTGRYVRINVSFSGGQPGPMGRSTTSMTLQSTINPGVGHGPGGGDTSASGGTDVGGAGGGGRTMHRGPGLSNAGLGRSFRVGR